MFFLLFLLDDGRIRIREARKHMDPPDPDPQHWFLACQLSRPSDIRHPITDVRSFIVGSAGRQQDHEEEGRDGEPLLQGLSRPHLRRCTLPGGFPQGALRSHQPRLGSHRGSQSRPASRLDRWYLCRNLLC
jgi:hypothetical protein